MGFIFVKHGILRVKFFVTSVTLIGINGVLQILCLLFNHVIGVLFIDVNLMRGCLLIDGTVCVCVCVCN